MWKYSKRLPASLPNSESLEISECFESYGAWQTWLAEHPRVLSPDWLNELSRSILDRGFVEPLTNSVVPGDQIHWDGRSLREGFSFGGVNSRVRAVMAVIADTFDLSDKLALRCYAAEGLTPFALRMRGLFPRFIGSEYTDDTVKRGWMWPIPFETLLGLSYDSDVFDLVSTNEVLEHVPSIDTAMKEIHRVLKPGGWHIGTCPFAFMDEASIVKARLVDGIIDYLAEPEYHGNPMSRDGSLVFEIPAWDILTRCHSVGFSRCHMRFIVSGKHACLSEHVGGIFILCCQK